LKQKSIIFYNHTLDFSEKGLKTGTVRKKYKSTEEAGYPKITEFMELCVSASLQVYGSLIYWQVSKNQIRLQQPMILETLTNNLCF